MANAQPASNQKSSVPKTETTATKTKHVLRTTASGLLGSIALSLIIASIMVLWLSNTLTNTDQYVKTVSSLASNKDIQAFVVDQAADGLLSQGDDKGQVQQPQQPGQPQPLMTPTQNNDHDAGAPIRDIASQLLPADQVAGKTDEQLKQQVMPIVKDSLQSVVSSPAFASLWETNNRSIHASLISQLNSNAPTLNLDFHPVIVGAVSELGTTKLAFIKDKLELKDDMGKIKLEGDQLNNVRDVYHAFKTSTVAILVAALVTAALAIAISVHHVKTARRIALLTGVIAAVMAAALSATSLIKVDSDPVQQKFSVALVDHLTHDLRITLIIIAIIGIGGAIASKVYSVRQSRALATSPK